MRIVIIGGVAAGMSAAARARRLNEQAEIIVIERTHHVSFANCGLPYHLGDVIEERESLLLQTPKSLAASLNLDVRIGHEVKLIETDKHSVTVQNLDAGQHYQLPYDKLVLCPGAGPVLPKLPGIEHPKIFTLRNIENMDAIKSELGSGAKKAIVVGASYIGLEVAENFKHIGLEVTVVEIAPQLMPILDIEMSKDLQYHLQYHGVTLKLGCAAQSFEPLESGILVTLDNSEQLSADFVVMAVGVRPDIKLLNGTDIKIGETGGILVNERMQTSVEDIYAAGDAVEVKDTITGLPALIALAGPANRQGRIVADNIFGIDSLYQSTQGTAVLKLFDMTAAITGASERSLLKVGINYKKIYLHPSGHAGYYPNTHPMHLKVLFEPDSGQLLGAQIVGYDGIDKRIDIFAVALRQKMTVFDLCDLELAYAPPYGSAKDPVNMAGFIASNFIKGDIDFWYAEDFDKLPEDALIIDVRSASEFSSWHIEGAVNIPLANAREELHSLPKDIPLYLYCRVGFRSYLAHRIFVQSGFREVKTLAGGSKTFCSFHKTPLCTGKPGLPFIAHAEDMIAKLHPSSDSA